MLFTSKIVKINFSHIFTQPKQLIFMKKLFIVVLSLLCGFIIGTLGSNSGIINRSKKVISNYNPFDNTNKGIYLQEFSEIKIPSSQYNHQQPAYFYKSKSHQAMPLVISLHTWSGDYQQDDYMQEEILKRDWNYIHPHFQGKNDTPNACLSDKVIADIDDAIDFAIENANVDVNKIYVIGVSGGGYAALGSFFKSRHKISMYSCWVPITDLKAWYYQSKIRNNNYWRDILKCTNSKGDTLNHNYAIIRSPLYWDVPIEKLESTKIDLFAGVYDGIDGSVPITHSINMYNKLLESLKCPYDKLFVSDFETKQLLEIFSVGEEYGMLGDRKIVLQKEYKNVRITIFKGNHEMLSSNVLDIIYQRENKINQNL